ncbi:DNA primase protein [Haloplasma contractile SSD-17B]|uniref:DNA primase n=2 Tax=Haloplasma TaxID=471824 RepID=U2E060_9MOLU|nr:DNA primase protein [Haloplasma contractile SSD-17B]
MPRIPNNVLDEIISRTDIVNIVSEYVKLEKKGKNYFGLCPFHNEKTPSFSVSPEKQIYHCFSCGEGGNAINFISNIESVSYQESIKRLSDKANIRIDQYYDVKSDQKNQNYYRVNKLAKEFFTFCLNKTTEGKEALDYLQERDLTEEIINKFGIGLAPNGRHLLYDALKENNVSEIAMLELGHISVYDETYYDKFRDRIMFPIYDEHGNIVAFSGRTYHPDHKDEPKYINTQETPLFKKSKIVYNLNNAKRTIKQKDRVFLLEGFMDVIKASKAGLLESVATMGTSLTDEHAKKLRQYTKNAILLYDADHAGIDATRRAIRTLYKQRFNISIVTLPQGLDPDDFIKKYNNSAFIEYVNNRQKSVNEYFYDLYKRNTNTDHISSIEEFKAKTFKLLMNSSETEREFFLKKMANDIDVSIETLYSDLETYLGRTRSHHKPVQNGNTKNYSTTTNNKSELPNNRFGRIAKKFERYKPKDVKKAQETLIFFAMNNKISCKIITSDTSITFPEQNYRRLIHDLENYYELYESFDIDNFCDHYTKEEDPEYRKFVNELYDQFKRDGYDNNPYDEVKRFTDEHIEQCKKTLKRSLIYSNYLKLKNEYDNSPDDVERVKLTHELVQLLQLKNKNV